MATPNVVHFNALRGTLEKTDRILLGNSDVRVSIPAPSTSLWQRINEPFSNAPSWTYRGTIYLSRDVLARYRESKSAQDYSVAVLGLNYHELAHVLYTPSVNTPMGKMVQDHYLGASYNILEDQRIETLFCTRYANAANYFAIPIMEHCVENDSHMAFAFVHGRRYISRKVRDAVEKRFDQWVKKECPHREQELQETKQRIKEIIDEYRLLTFTSRSRSWEAFNLVQEYDRLMNSVTNNSPEDNAPQEDSGQTGGCARGESGQEHRESNSKQEQTAQQASEDTQEQDKEDQQEREQERAHDDTDSDSDSEQESDSDSDAMDDSDGMGDAETSLNGKGEIAEDLDDDIDPENTVDGYEGEDEHDDGDSDSANSPLGDASGSGVNSDPNTPIPDDSQSMEQIIQDAINDILQDEDLIREVTNMVQTVQHREATFLESETESGDEYWPIDSDMRNQSRSLESELSKLMDTVAPGWVYGENEGRFNVGRYLNSEHGDDDYWDRWDEGKEQDIGCEVFIGLDCSGSMDGVNIYHATRAMWILKRACDSLEISTTVAAFGHPEMDRVIYGRGDRTRNNEFLTVEPRHPTTKPDATMEMGKVVMDNTKNKVKLFIMITDGIWDYGKWKNIIDTIDATKMLVGIGVSPNAIGSYRFDYQEFFASGELHGLSALLRETVRGAMAKAAGR